MHPQFMPGTKVTGNTTGRAATIVGPDPKARRDGKPAYIVSVGSGSSRSLKSWKVGGFKPAQGTVTTHAPA